MDMEEQNIKHLLNEASNAINNLIKEQHRKSRIRSGGYRKKHNLASGIGRDNK